jgi:SPP1 gp7 family putative phage head morphogenesis protein
MPRRHRQRKHPSGPHSTIGGGAAAVAGGVDLRDPEAAARVDIARLEALVAARSTRRVVSLEAFEYAMPGGRGRPATAPQGGALGWMVRPMASALQTEANSYHHADWDVPHPSTILRDKSLPVHREGELYDHMLQTDTALASFRRKRSDAVLALPRAIHPGDASREASEAADLCRWALGRIPSWSIILRHQLDSRSKGHAISEVVWDEVTRGPWAGAWVPVDLVDRPMWRFAWRYVDRQGRPVGTSQPARSAQSGAVTPASEPDPGTLRLHVRRPGAADPILAPAGAFLVLTHGTADDPRGAAILDEVYWTWWLKKHGLKFYAVFLEKWGQPTAWGKYPHRGGRAATDADKSANQASQAALLAALEAIQTNSAIAVPEGFQIDLLEATRSGDAGYERFVGLLDRYQALAYLGEVDTSGTAKGPGSFAKSEISNEVRLEKVELDAHDLGAHVRDQLFRPLVELNFGPDCPLPSFEIDTLDAGDREARKDGIDRAMRAQVAVPERYARLTWQVPAPRGSEAVLAVPAPAPPPPSPPEAPVGADDPAASAAAPTSEPDPAESAADSPEPPPRPAALAAATLPAAPAIAPSPAPLPAVRLAAGDELADLEAAAVERQRDLDTIAAAFAPLTVRHASNLRTLLEEAWDVGAVGEGTALGFAVARWDLLAHADHLAASLIHGAGLAALDLEQDLAGVPLAPSRTSPATSALAAAPGALTLAATAAQAASATTAAAARGFWSTLLDIGRAILEQLADGWARREAATRTAVADVELLLDVSELLSEARASGIRRPDFVARLEQLFASRGLEPRSPWHAELIHHQGTRNANALLRYQNTVGNPAAARLVPYLQYLSLDDVRVRPEHQLLHRRIFAVTHPIWRTIFPPWEFGCRCDVATINLARARRLGLTGMEPDGPPPTIDGQPITSRPGYQTIGELADDLASGAPPDTAPLDALRTRAAASGNRDLIDAVDRVLATLLGQLGTVPRP